MKTMRLDPALSYKELPSDWVIWQGRVCEVMDYRGQSADVSFGNERGFINLFDVEFILDPHVIVDLEEQKAKMAFVLPTGEPES